jgi:hypothetical protein
VGAVGVEVVMRICEVMIYVRAMARWILEGVSANLKGLVVFVSLNACLTSSISFSHEAESSCHWPEELHMS